MKYEFTGETKSILGCTLRRIRAIKDFGNVKKGDMGGWIENERNLSHDGNAWVADEACVFGNARVFGDVYIFRNVLLSGDASASGKIKIYGNGWLCGKTLKQYNIIIDEA